MSFGRQGPWRLRPGERLLWEGQPVPRAYAFAGSWLLLPFSLLWGGFAIFWEVTVIAAGAPVFFWLWGLPFVAIGLYMIGGRFVVADRTARRTWYAVTDRRILLSTGFFGQRMTELDLTNLPPIHLDAARSGTSTITFGQDVFGPMRAWSMGNGWMMGPGAAAFVAIADGDRVFELVSEARVAALREQLTAHPG